jgi:hypothetical protein
MDLFSPITLFPGYQVPFAIAIKEQSGIVTGAVRMINDEMDIQIPWQYKRTF